MALDSAKARSLYRLRCTFHCASGWRQEDGSNESIFGHCFLTLTSNLMMCRSKNTILVQREHIDRSGDAMTIQFTHSKSDREGQDAGNKRHVYADPFMPAICPVLSIATLL